MNPLGNLEIGAHLFRCDSYALSRRIWCRSQPVDDGLGNVGAGHHPVDEGGIAGLFE